MFGSDKGLVPQLLNQKNPKRKAPKTAYRDLLETEKSSLLNFQFNDYHEYHEHYADRPSKSKTLSYTEKRQLKQNYLQGNFRFFVNPDYEENITYVDPDQEVKWKTVEKVKYITNNLIVCPICLNDQYDMAFPKITRCGHMFCWHCILKYLSYKKSKCPLCDDFLMEDDLRSIEIIHYNIPQPSEKIVLKLKKRRKAENTVFNAESFVEEPDFIRIKRISWEDILHLREEETQALVDYLSILEIEGDRESKPYIEQALRHLGTTGEKIHRSIAQTKQKRGRNNEEEEKELEGGNDDEFLYFYQEMNGLNIFLHPINNKYIKMQHNDNAKKLPLTIEASLIEMRGFQQTDTSQKRYKFINHIPLNSDINFAEVEMKDLLSARIHAQLNDEFEIYKLNAPKKKEAPVKSTDLQSIPHPAPKKIFEVTERKYKIDFPRSPGGLKLDDKEDYPELSAATQSAEDATAKGAWQTKIPSRKRNQNTKKAHEKSAVLTEQEVNIRKFVLEVEDLSGLEELKKASKPYEGSADAWTCVKADKQSQRGKKK